MIRHFRFGPRSLTFVERLEQLPLQHIPASKKVMLVDCDGTISRHNKSDIYPEAKQYIQHVLAAEAVEQVALVSNNPDQALRAQRQEQLGLGDDSVFTPASVFERKPRAVLIHKALGRFGCQASEAIGVGDGITDAMAYLSAGVDTVLVDPFGPEEAQGYPGRPQVRRVTNYLLGAVGIERHQPLPQNI